jgi:hypothetical protein
MKKLFYILMFLYPVVLYAQQSWYKSSPLDYMWMNVGNAGFSTEEAMHISLAFSPSDGQPYVAYEEANSMKATVMKFNGTNWVYVGTAGFSGWGIYYTSLAFSLSGEPYVAYTDNLLKATVMKFDGTNWVLVGNASFSAGRPDFMGLAFSPSDNKPYVGYSDAGNSNKATVMKFDGTSWVNVGIAGFSAGYTEYTSIAFSLIGQPYIAYEDWGNSQKATVMKFDGTNWANVGNAGFSAGIAFYESLAFSPSGQPYVAYSEYADSLKATVMKFDGTNWVNVGNPKFSANCAINNSLVFSPSGEPYVAYEDDFFIYPYDHLKATIIKFNGTNWVYVGSRGFSEGEITSSSTSLAFSPSGRPNMAYTDYANSYKATVMKYDSVFVGINEPQESNLWFYPNPATDKITVESPKEVKGTNLAIVNIEGQQIITCQITEPKTQIDISNLPSGVYFVRLTCERTVSVGKFVKQ